MSHFIGHEEHVKELIQTGLDANASVNSNSIDVGPSRLASFQVLANTGVHTTHVYQLQCSLDGINFSDISGATLNQLGIKGGIGVSTKFIRLKPSVLEGAASTVDIIIQAK